MNDSSKPILPDPTTTPSESSASRPRRPRSMHEDVPVWYDCCSCEAEPYWLEAVEGVGDQSECEDRDKNASRDSRES
jgi:hypothetical protein